MPTRQPKIRTISDALAVVFCVGLFSYLFFAKSRGVGFVDEGFYYTITQRLMQGDRLLVDEWHVTQLPALFQLLPHRLYLAVNGNNDGVLLFMRFFYLTVDLLLYWVYYIRFRDRGLAAAFAAPLFCGFMFAGICAFGYYTMCLHAAALIFFLVFHKDKKVSVPAGIGAGVVLSAMVLMELPFAALYVLYSFFVLVYALRKGKGKLFRGSDFLLDRRLWCLITVGVAVSAAAFFVYLCVRVGLKPLFEAVPELFTDSEYGMRWFGNYRTPRKITGMFEMYGAVPLAALALLVPVGAVCGKKRAPGAVRALVLLLAEGAMTASWITAALRLHKKPELLLYAFFGSTLHVVLFALICRFLCKEKEKRLDLLIWMSVGVSVFRDYFSDVTVGYGGALAYFPAAHYFFELLRELRADRAEDRSRSGFPAAKALAAAAAALCVLPLCGDLYSVWVTGSFYPIERAYNTTTDRAMTALITEGPYRGIRTTETFKTLYDNVLEDIGSVGGDGPFYVAGQHPYYYLCTDAPLGAYSSWYVDNDSTGRLQRYWQLHPEKRPAYIYVPMYEYYTLKSYETAYGTDRTARKLAELNGVCSFTARRGRAGLILTVESWDLPPLPTADETD
ncbi:MAG: hypothetical protein IJL26_00265 [Clostridia bacterium]|nr:hypothetical protein [Clostridia bacterium]